MLVAIHQPNFLPWLGYFDKIVRADRFVLLDTVAAWRGGSHYHNRVQMLIGGRPAWLTVPLSRRREERARLIDCRIAGDDAWRRKMKRTVAQSYARAPHFGTIMPLVEGWLSQETDNLMAVNVNAITAICARLGIPVDRLIRASDLDVPGSASELLAGLVRAAGGDTYLSGGGADGYQEDRAFGDAGVTLSFQNFDHPTYVQTGVQKGASTFHPGLSIVDALMNCGFDGTRALLGG